MRLMTWMILTVWVLSPFSMATAWALNEEAQVAKEEGMRLWGIHQWEKMQPPLEIAAESGDLEAMYYLGEANRLLSRGLSQAALDWYHQAAEHGDPHAMLRLHSGGACELGDVCPKDGNDWRQAALETTLPQAKDGDPDAMFALYSVYATLEDAEASNKWLMQAAEVGSVEAQNLLGRQTRGNRDSYPDDTGRLKAAERWFRMAAEAGHAPSMSYLSATLNNLGEFQEAWEWIVKASDAGNINGRQWIATCYINPEESEMCNVEKNPAKGWAIFLAINEEVPGTSSERFLRFYREEVTAEQRAEGEAMMDEWLNREPPLSYFPDKFGP
nr:tetratricopeptide repeat protein [Halomonas socia]